MTPPELVWRQPWVCKWCRTLIQSHEAHVRPAVNLVFHERCYKPMLVALRLSK